MSLLYILEILTETQKKHFPFQFLVKRAVNTLQVLNSSSLAVGHIPTGLFWMKRKNKKIVKRRGEYYLKCKCQCTSWLHTWIILTDILCLWNPETGCDKCLACIEVTQKQHFGQSFMFLTWKMGYGGIIVENQVSSSTLMGKPPVKSHLVHGLWFFFSSEGRAWERTTVSWKVADV